MTQLLKYLKHQVSGVFQINYVENEYNIIAQSPYKRKYPSIRTNFNETTYFHY